MLEYLMWPSIMSGFQWSRSEGKEVQYEVNKMRKNVRVLILLAAVSLAATGCIEDG